MALKRKISEEAYNKLPSDLKVEYIKDGDDYKLDIDGDEDTGALKRAKDRESQARKDAEAELKEVKARLVEIEGVDNRKKTDIATLEKSWQSKLDSTVSEYSAKMEKLTKHSQTTLVDNVANSIASKISKAPALLIPIIKSRLQADFEGDMPKTRILDKEGKPSALTIEDLEKEIVANPDFSAIIIGSKSSGGATGSKSVAGNNGVNPQARNLASIKPSEMAEFLKSQSQ